MSRPGGEQVFDQQDDLHRDGHHATPTGPGRGAAGGRRAHPIIECGRRERGGGGSRPTIPPCAHRRRGWNNIPNGSSPPLPDAGGAPWRFPVKST